MLKKFCLIAGACLLSFLILEGFCSSLFVAYQLWSPEEHRTLSGPSVQYDRELGWVSVANFYEKSYYAPNIDLRTNSRGFRANEEFTERVPPGKLRIICSGDSFTFGEGVANDHTWCQDLESIDDRLQTVNMAESGYGVDQMYLRYRREGPALDHNVHVFAFITEDFRRMQLTNYVGYGKPVLKLRNGELVADNIPVPSQSRFLSWLGFKRIQMRELRSVQILGSLVGRVLPARDSVFSKGPTDEQAQILDKMLEALQTMEKQKNSVLVLACLPTTLHNFEQGGPSPAWREWIREESAKRAIVLVDLIDDFQKLPVTMRDGLFIWPGSVQYFAEAPGHYDDQGNEWVAKKFYARLISIPEVAEKLGLHSEKQVATQGVDSDVRSADAHAPSK